MDIELLKKVAHEKLITVTLEKLPEDTKLALKMRLDTILSNYSTTLLLDQLYQYLRMVHALRDSNIINEEQFKRLMIDYDTIKAILS